MNERSRKKRKEAEKSAFSTCTFETLRVMSVKLIIRQNPSFIQCVVSLFPFVNHKLTIMKVALVLVTIILRVE